MFAQYFDYYAIILSGHFFMDTVYIMLGYRILFTVVGTVLLIC